MSSTTNPQGDPRNPQIFTGGSAETNGYLFATSEGAILIDAPSGIAQWLRAKDIKPAALLLTHQHYDHVEDVQAVHSWANCPIYAFAPHSRNLTLEDLLESVGMSIDVPPYVIDHILEWEKEITICGLKCVISHIPGHALDSVTFYFSGHGVVYAGDTLFAGGVGRTDLPGGSWAMLRDGIRRDLFSLPPETLVFSGHGESTTIGAEIKHNAFFR